MSFCKRCRIPNKITFVCVLNGCASPAALEQGKMIHAYIIQAGYERNLWVVNTLIRMYAKCGSMADARNLFDTLPYRDVVSWTAMISRYTQQSYDEQAMKLSLQMQQENVKPDKMAFTSILSACSSPATLEQGKKIHKQVVEAGYDLDVALAKCSSESCTQNLGAWRIHIVSLIRCLTEMSSHGLQ